MQDAKGLIDTTQSTGCYSTCQTCSAACILLLDVSYAVLDVLPLSGLSGRNYCTCLNLAIRPQARTWQTGTEDNRRMP